MTDSDLTSLAGKRVLVSISDPWDFVTDNGGSRTGVIIHDASLANGTVAIKLDVPVRAREIVADVLFARGRHVGKPISDILRADFVACNFSNKGNLSGPPGTITLIGALRLSEDGD